MKCVSFLNLKYVLDINLWWAAEDKITSWKSDAHWDETGHFSKVIIHWLLICDRDYFEKEKEKRWVSRWGKTLPFYTCFGIEISAVLF